MPACCHNQRYVNYSVYFNQYCCGACSVAHVELYRGAAYSNSGLETDLKNAHVISDINYGADWSKCPYGKIKIAKDVTSYSALYELIKSEIDANRPVIIKQTGSGGHSILLLLINIQMEQCRIRIFMY